MKLRNTQLDFGYLQKRYDTDAIVIHHSDGGNDVDFSAEDIHRMHQNLGWAGAGYHFIIRKDGTVEDARPEWAVGAHVEGHNYYTLGICFSGDFEFAYPSPAQIAACVELIRDLSRDYDIPIDRDHILGHRELCDTDCPGQNLYSWLDTIVRQAANDS